MKLLIALLLTLSSYRAFAGTLVIRSSAQDEMKGATLKFYSLENRAGVKYLYLVNNHNQACRVPITVLKEYNIDPLHLANLLMNSNDPAPIFECRIPRVELNKNQIASDISFTSFVSP